MSTTSQRPRAFADHAPAHPAHEWRWVRILVWSTILAGCTVFWAGVVALLLAL